MGEFEPCPGLRIEKTGGAWCPKQQVERGVREWLQIDLSRVHVVTGVETQGRYDHGRGQEYAEEYTLEYWRPGLETWREYTRWDGKKILSGNSDTATVVSHRLMPPVYATQVRVLPYSVHRRTVCLRAELVGCPAEGGVVAYSIPEEPSGELSPDLTDVAYDGWTKEGRLIGGLGRLVDGEVGGDNFKLDIGYGKGSGWVAWKNDSFPNRCVELVFEFDQIRNFSAVHIFTNNLFTKHVQVFSRAKVTFSIGGQFFNGRPLVYTYMPDTVLEQARNVSINLHSRLAKFIKLQLYFADRWIMISEVTFDSALLYGNLTEESEAILSDEEIEVNSIDGDLSWDSFETIAAADESQGYGEAVIGVLTAVMLLLLVVFVVILVLSRRHKLQGSPTILRNPFGVTINMKDLLMNLAPMGNGVTGGGTLGGGSLSGGCGGSSIGGLSLSGGCTAPGSLMAGGLSSEAATPMEPSCPEEPRSPEDSEDPISDVTSSPPPEPPPPPPPPPPSTTTSYYSGQQQSSSYATLRTRDCGPTLVHSSRSASTPQVPAQSSDTDDANIDLDIPSPRSPLTTSVAAGGSLSSLRGSGTHRHNSTGRVMSETTSRKRYHTAPRGGDKHRGAPPPSVAWHLAPSMTSGYKAPRGDSVELLQVPRYCLRPLEQMGQCYAGEVVVCEGNGLSDLVPDATRLVAVRTTSADSLAGLDSLRELRFLAALSDPNIAKLLAVCTNEQPHWAVFEYPEMGDLAHYLQYRVPKTATSLRGSATNLQGLSFGCLMFMATQVASGMRYLESRHVVHKDLAARNCLVGRGYLVKIADIAACSPLYRKDYSEIGGRPPAPIRWLPWESILLDRYTCPGSVWSFAVTLWEILSLAREKPFQQLTNEQVIRNAEHMYYGGELQVLLPKPTLCPVEVYDLMCECWRRDESSRPSFKEIYMFLKRKNIGYRPGD